MTNQTTISSSLTLIDHQIKSLFPKNSEMSIDKAIGEIAFNKTTACVKMIKAWRESGFDYLVSWQYASYLYFLSREVWLQSGDEDLATRIFLVNKAMNALELFYKIDLPSYFFLSHTTGLVFAQATYGDFGVFHQGCTVGRNGNDRPILEEGVILYPNSSVIGKCLVRANTVIAPGVQLINQDTPGNCCVFTGEKGRPIFKEINEFYADRYFERLAI